MLTRSVTCPKKIQNTVKREGEGNEEQLKTEIFTVSKYLFSGCDVLSGSAYVCVVFFVFLFVYFFFYPQSIYAFLFICLRLCSWQMYEQQFAWYLLTIRGSVSYTQSWGFLVPAPGTLINDWVSFRFSLKTRKWWFIQDKACWEERDY